MKLKLLHGLLSVAILFSFVACQDGGAGFTTNVTGKAGELVVVISDAAWQGSPGEAIRQTLAQEHVALPQDEPLFDLVKVPREGFKNIFKTTRNIMQVRISSNLDTFGVTFQENVWASPQSMVIIQAQMKVNFRN